MAATHWIRFEQQGRIGFGRLEADGRVRVHDGDMFANPRDTGELVAADGLKRLAPVARPGKIIGLWNNFGQLAAKLNLARPAEPLYFIKASSAVLDPGATIRRPPEHDKIVFEGELVVVIGRRATRVSAADAMKHVFGFTCVNDVTVPELLTRDASFAQWSRAKSFDTFCPLGPTIATGLDPATLTVRTVLDGSVRQDYPIADMRFSVGELVSMISHDMTLEPGDLILCGTSVGVGSMKSGARVSVTIEGIGTLENIVE